MLKNRTKRTLAMLLSLSMIVGGTNITAFAQSNSASVTGVETASVSQDDVVQISEGWDGVTKENVFEGNGFKVTYKLKDSWNGGYNASVQIDNTSDKVIENWTLGFDYQGGIASVWNAVLESFEQGKCIVKNAGWNQDIVAGESVEFGINGQGDFAGFPCEYQMLGQISSVSEKDYSIDYKVTSDWTTGFNANITIANNTSDDLADWILEFDYDRNITEIWDATIISHKGNHYVIKNNEYNSVIKSNKSISFGFNGKDGNDKDIPLNYEVKAFQNECTVSFEVGSGKIKNVPEKQVVKRGMHIVKPIQPKKREVFL